MSDTTELPAPTKEHALVEKRIGQYVATRDAISELKEKHKKELQPLVDLQNSLTGWLTKFMDDNGADSIRAKTGTCYASLKHTASLADPDIFMKYVIETQAWDLLDRKANVTAVRAYVEENNHLPPGVNLSSIETIGVRSPTK